MLYRWRAFFYGQLSGVVEPIAAVIGAAVVTAAEPILPYALCFAAGAMIYVVFDDIIPEAQVYCDVLIIAKHAHCRADARQRTSRIDSGNYRFYHYDVP